MKFYHFTSAEKFESMESGIRMGQFGLLPLSRYLSEGAQTRNNLPSKASEPVIFGFLAPFHAPWYRKQYDKDVPYLEKVLDEIVTVRDQGIYLLEITLLAKDDAYITERAGRVRADYTDQSRCTNDVMREVVQSFWESKKDIAEYEDGPIAYMMPEIICFNPIPTDRLRLVRTFNKQNVINHVRMLAGLALHVVASIPSQKTTNEGWAEPAKPLPRGKPSHLHLVQ